MNYSKRITTRIIEIIFILLCNNFIRIYGLNNYYEEKDEIKKIKEKNINGNIHNNIENYSEKHIKILRETAEECTLFLNNNKEFPINNPTTVLLLGSGAR